MQDNDPSSIATKLVSVLEHAACIVANTHMTWTTEHTEAPRGGAVLDRQGSAGSDLDKTTQQLFLRIV